MRIRELCLILITALITSGFISGCATTAVKPQPIFMSPSLAEMQLDTIYLLPIVDARVDKSKYDPDDLLMPRIQKKIEKMGYRVVSLERFKDNIDIKCEEISEMEIPELCSLGPDEANVLLVVFLDDASGKAGLGYSFKIEATGVLLDKNDTNMLWKDKGVGSKGQGGLVGLAMAPMVKGDASNLCVNRMFQSFPERTSNE